MTWLCVTALYVGGVSDGCRIGLDGGCVIGDVLTIMTIDCKNVVTLCGAGTIM